MVPDVAEARRLIGHSLNPHLSADQRTRLQEACARLSPEDWQTLVTRADGAAVLPDWHLGLQHHGLAAHLPTELAEALEASWLLNRARNATLRNEALALSDLLAEIGCGAVYLKGMGHILGGTYADRGARMTGDLDVLVPRARVQEAARHLLAQGYAFPDMSDDEGLILSDFSHHLAALKRAGDLAAVELHHAFLSHRAEPVPMEALMAEALRPETGHAARVPCPFHAACLAVAHSTLRRKLIGGRHLNLRDMMDFVTLCPPGTPWAADLPAVFRTAGAEAELGAFLHVTETLFGLDIASLGLETLARRHQNLGTAMLADRTRPPVQPRSGLLRALRQGMEAATSAEYRRHLWSLATDPAYRAQRRAALRARMARRDPGDRG